MADSYREAMQARAIAEAQESARRAMQNTAGIAGYFSQPTWVSQTQHVTPDVAAAAVTLAVNTGKTQAPV
jgi:hypothetical protein